MGIRIGIGEVKNVREIYIDVDGVVNKVKEGYIGVDGSPKLFYKLEPLEKIIYYGLADPLSEGRYLLAAASNNTYAIFAGGTTQYNSNLTIATTPSAVVDAYDVTLTRTSPKNNLGIGYKNLEATSVGDFVFFAGGGPLTATSSQVVRYNSTLTRAGPTSLYYSVTNLAAASNQNYALFAGGISNSSSSGCRDTVNAYNTTSTKSTLPTVLPAAVHSLAGASFGDYAIFAGGENQTLTFYKFVSAYDNNLTVFSASDLSSARSSLKGIATNEYAFFAGGTTGGNNRSTTVDIYDKQLTRVNSTASLSLARFNMSAASLNGFALFAGGNYTETSAQNPYDRMDIFDKFLTRTLGTALSASRTALAATTIGNYALFGGGVNIDPFSIVDVYTTEYN